MIQFNHMNREEYGAMHIQEQKSRQIEGVRPSVFSVADAETKKRRRVSSFSCLTVSIYRIIILSGVLLCFEEALRDCLVSALLYGQHLEPVLHLRLEEFSRNRYARGRSKEVDAEYPDKKNGVRQNLEI